MIATRNYDQVFVGSCVDKSICLIYPPGPEAGEAMLQCLGLTNSTEGVSLRIFDYFIDAFERFFVLRLPVDVAAPSLIRERYIAHVPGPQYREC